MIPIFLGMIENENDRAFLEELYEELYALMYLKVLEITHDEHNVDDIIHIAMVRLINKLSLLQTMEKHVQVSYTIRTVINTAKNEISSKIRGRKYTYSGSLSDISDEMPDPCDPFEETIYTSCDYESLGHAMKKLPERDRELLYYKYVLEMDEGSIAQSLDINLSNIRVYLSRARQRARKLIMEEEQAC